MAELKNSNTAHQPPTLPLHGRTAIVTGASRGIGRAIAAHFASIGANTIINYASNSTSATAFASQINTSSSHSQAIAIQANISDPIQVKSLFDQAEQAFGSQIHILVNCAGIIDSKFPILAETSNESWDSMFSVNAKGAFLCCREAANRLKRGGGGRIISITSSMVAGLEPGFAAYAASKAAVETMTKILAKELKGSGITANCIAPGPTATDMMFSGTGREEDVVKQLSEASPLSRVGEPDDIASVVGFLAGDSGEWVNGQVIRVNGGLVVA